MGRGGYCYEGHDARYTVVLAAILATIAASVVHSKDSTSIDGREGGEGRTICTVDVPVAIDRR